jgi:hypothetical protein
MACGTLGPPATRVVRDPAPYEDTVTRDPNQRPATAGQHAGRSESEAERQEKITQLFQRDSKLSTSRGVGLDGRCARSPASSISY